MWCNTNIALPHYCVDWYQYISSIVASMTKMSWVEVAQWLFIGNAELNSIGVSSWVLIIVIVIWRIVFVRQWSRVGGGKYSVSADVCVRLLDDSLEYYICHRRYFVEVRGWQIFATCLGVYQRSNDIVCNLRNTNHADWRAYRINNYWIRPLRNLQ